MSTAKRLLALLLCLIMIFSVVSCASDNSEETSSASDGSSNITLPSEVPAGYVSLAEHEKANYRIVYEDGLASTVTSKINTPLRRSNPK